MTKQNIIANKAYLFKAKRDKISGGETPPVFRKEFCLTIPPYQRPYSWKKDHIIQLINDFESTILNSAGETELPEYFIGSIMTMNNDNQRVTEIEIIDGQQRLTSIFLILLWLKNHTSNEELNQIYSDIKDNFKMSYPDNKILEEIKDKSSNDSILKFLSRKPREYNSFEGGQFKVFSNIFKNINTKFSSYSSKDLKIFIDYLLNHVYCLYIKDTPYSDFGDTLFLSLNGKGLKLDQVDLIKSYFIQPYIGDHDELVKFKEKWADIIINTENKFKKNLPAFFSDRLTFKGSDWAKQIQNEIGSKNSKIKDCYERLHKFFKNNKRILIDMDTGSHEFDFYLKLFNKFNYTKVKQILSPFCEIFDDEKNELILMLKNLFKINFIYMSYSGQKASRFNKEVADVCTTDIIQKGIKEDKTKSKILSEVNKFLEATLQNILLNQVQGLADISKFNITDYSYSKSNEIIYLARLLSNSNNWSSKSVCYDFEEMNSQFNKSLDHLVPKRNAIINEKVVKVSKRGKKKTKIKKTKIFVVYSDNEKVKFENYPITDLFSEQFIEKFKIKNDMLYEEFLGCLNQPFNLDICGKALNSRGKNVTNWSVEEIKQHFDIRRINKENKKMNDAVHYFFFNEMPETDMSITESWKKIIKIVGKINDFTQEQIDQYGTSILVVRLKDLASKEILEKDEIDFLHNLRKLRNKIEHPEDNEDSRTALTKREYEMCENIIDKLEEYLNK